MVDRKEQTRLPDLDGRKRALWLFAAAAAIIYTVVYFVTRTPRGLVHPQLIGASALFDLTVTAGAVCYFLLVRRGYASWLMLLTVGLCGMRAAAFVMPALERQYMPSPNWIGAPFELMILAIVVRRVRQVSSIPDALDRIRTAASAVIPQQRLSKIVAAEIAILYYALFSWRSKPETSESSQTFSCGEASGYGLLGGLFILLVLCEGLPLHFILWHFSKMAAWVSTVADTYCLLWALAMIRSVRLRRILVDESSIKVRVGLIWEADIRRQNILACRRATPAMKRGISEGRCIARSPIRD